MENYTKKILMCLVKLKKECDSGTLISVTDFSRRERISNQFATYCTTQGIITKTYREPYRWIYNGEINYTLAHKIHKWMCDYAMDSYNRQQASKNASNAPQLNFQKNDYDVRLKAIEDKLNLIIEAFNLNQTK